MEKKVKKAVAIGIGIAGIIGAIALAAAKPPVKVIDFRLEKVEV